MKRSAAILMAISLSFTLLSGCADSPENDGTAEAETAAAYTSAAPAVKLDESYNKLQTITVFGEAAPSGSGIPTLEPSDGTSLLP